MHSKTTGQISAIEGKQEASPMHSKTTSQISAIEGKLEKKLQAESGQVIVRELIGYQKIRQQATEAMGEFYLTAPRFADEERTHLIGRIKSFILQLAEVAKSQHLLDNFINPEKYISPSELEQLAFERAKKINEFPKEGDVFEQRNQMIVEKEFAYLNPSKMNHVTRLSLSEFSLYPSKLQGPLSHAEFTLLLEQLEEQLRELPENLHLLVGSIPVINSKHEVRNIAIYIECGPKGSIRPFAKAINHYTDPLYPETHNSDFVSTLPASAWADQIHEAALDLIQNYFNVLMRLGSSQLKELLVKLNKFRKLIQSNDDVKPADEFLTNIKNIEEYVRRKSISNISHQHILDFQTGVNQFKKSIDSFRGEQVKLMTAATAPANAKDGAIVFYSGKLKCITAGGARFDVYPEICLGHKHKEAFQRGVKEISITLDSGNILEEVPTSHMLLSNHIPLNSANLVSDSVVQADPVHSTNKDSVKHDGQAIRAIGSKPIATPAFASPISIDIYPPRALSSINAELRNVIVSKKPFTVRLRALQILKWQQPAQMMTIDEEIIKHILSPVNRALKSKDKALLAALEQSTLTYDEADDVLSQLLDTSSVSKDPVLHTEIRRARKLIRAEKADSERLTQILKPSTANQSKANRQFTGQNNARPKYNAKTNQDNETQHLHHNTSAFYHTPKQTDNSTTKSLADTASSTNVFAWSQLFNEQALPLLQLEATWVTKTWQYVSSLWHGTNRLSAQEAAAIKRDVLPIFEKLKAIAPTIMRIQDEKTRYEYLREVDWYDLTLSSVAADSHAQVRSKYDLRQLESEIINLHNEVKVKAEAEAEAKAKAKANAKAKASPANKPAI